MSIRPTDDDWMDLASVAKILGKKLDTVYNDRSQGVDLPPSYKFGQKVRYRRSDVDAWIERHRQVPSSVQVATLNSRT